MPPIQYWFTGTALATFIAVIAAVSTLGYPISGQAPNLL
jgi:hypothetical protein